MGCKNQGEKNPVIVTQKEKGQPDFFSAFCAQYFGPNSLKVQDSKRISGRSDKLQGAYIDWSSESHSSALVSNSLSVGCRLEWPRMWPIA